MWRKFAFAWSPGTSTGYMVTMPVIKHTKPSTTCSKVHFVFAPDSPAIVVVGGGAGVVAKAATVVVAVTAIMHEGVSYSMGVAGW